MMQNNYKGFTLVEMAVVIVIIGLILSAGIGFGSTQIQSAKIAATKQKQDTIRLALINFISRNNRLPCPAVANLAPGATGYGAEAATPGTCTSTNINGLVATGIVPWVTLGLSDENGTDGYYNRFTYQVVLTATNANAKTISYIRGAISTHTAAPTVLGAPVVGNQSNDCTAGGAYNPCAAIVVIVSHGNNGSGAYTSDGTQVPVPTGADEIENTNNDSKFVIKDYSTSTTNPFDDIVLPLSSTDLLSSLTARGSVKDYTSYINDDLSNIENSVVTYALTHRSGAPGSYSYPIVLPSSLPDPWGKPYSYQQFMGSLSGATIGTTVVYTIKSLGPDGVASADDITNNVIASQLQMDIGKAVW